ncbi:MAG: hypothetical protein ACR2HH_15875 [Chthoniobacterales bacterium]
MKTEIDAGTATLLMSEYSEVRRLHVEVGLQQFNLGERLVNLREQMGEASLKAALASTCPFFHWEDAEHYMNAALDSEFAHRLEAKEQSNRGEP